MKTAKKVYSLTQLEKILRKERARGKKIVTTNGCFDILHPGHISLLRKAKSYGDILVVGVNSDTSVRKLKGSTRPILKLHERVSILSALEMVDYIIIFRSTRPVSFLKKLKPHFHIKGGDYIAQKLPEYHAITKNGGKVITLPLLTGYSSTGIINRILRRH